MFLKIKFFIFCSKGRDINIKQACPLIGDLLDKVQSMINNNQEKKTFLHFTHAGVMKRLYSGLGLFSDLKSNNNLKYDESICLNDEREWKSSLISPFSANFAAVLHKCDHKDTNEDQNNAKFKLLTLVQENPVIINGCDSALCSVDKFMNTYQTMSSCDLSEICRI
jgi:multiple inositol-polyphosphate phosphatase/2,3-bisphosphoglycerate 3-phosphatase